MVGSEREVLAAGCDVYMTKPLDIDALVRTMAQLLGGERLESEAAARAPKAERAGALVQGLAVVRGPIASRLAHDRRFRPTLRKFVARLRERIVQAEAAIQARDTAAIAAFAHWLRGSAGSLGYDAFAQPALQLEQAAKSDDAGQAARLFAEVRSLAERVVVPEDETAAA
jgi:HPt (histidine-containing phosphotransfer) domain-containing protein